ncbi:helix-turn-helix domain-containing protein [Aggregatimonas sangjinii]|uniref:Helix-turn-helix domain-containing protein n=1 Tax=Aggregatimonas sangjinii TaxID=2583587 RepID=A0A5B7SQT1_9FLAO|nr:transposase [Aggregatimonas sangjinii]QCW99003.1 helix-turn-helix domain-containing protein [Aggregatimonas sangjinii]QCW99856.1 helix-turn-helix domain-containing protein [Aggregatimonas sangjinii]QCW99945.1 helix-turn-helix domain-containing protein [Aggregatimonas sangjinii]
MTRRKFTPKFKTKVVLEALKERETAQELAQRFEISPQQVNLWKREFLAQAESVFIKGPKSAKSEAEEKEDHLLKVIGKQKVELDFLKNALR